MKPIRGAKGGGSAPRTPVETPDSLQSIAYFRVLDLVSEGEIAGLVNGQHSVFLDDTPMVNEDGSLNFEGAHIESRVGTQAQTHIAGFDAVENEMGVGVEVTGTTPWVATIVNTDVSAIRITLGWPALSKADPDTGDVAGYSIEYRIEVKTDSGPFVPVLNTAVTGKTTSKYQRSHRVDLPAGTRWQVRVSRQTPNARLATIADYMQVDSYAELIDAKLRYPNSALIGVMGDARRFSNVPRRAYDLWGRIIRVPSNYDVVTRTYSGVWDGQFKPSWSDNPAWVFYDIATHPRYGLGQMLDASLVDKWSLYAIGRYCDELVDDGKGGQEPRFACNLYLQSQADAFKVLNDLASVFRGISYWAGGAIVAHADMPADPAYTYNPSNVVDGRFTYAGSPRQSRYTVAHVTWNDPANMCRSAVEYVEDSAGLDRYGYQPIDVTAVGCTSQGQAQRVGQWLLTTSRLETDTVTFQVGLDGVIAAPGQIVVIADPLHQRRGGRIRQVSGTSVTLDRSPMGVGVGDTLVVNNDTGAAESRTITDIVGQAASIATPFSRPLAPGAAWSVTPASARPRLYRVLSVAEDTSADAITFTITALRHEPAKFGDIDAIPPGGGGPGGPPLPLAQRPPTHVVISEDLAIDDRRGAVITMGIAWDPPSDGTAVRYRVAWRKDEDNWVDLAEVTTPSAFVEDVEPGYYLARVIAISGTGLESSPAQSLLTQIVGKVDGSGAPFLRATAEDFAIELDWDFPPGAGDTAYTEIVYAEGDGKGISDPADEGLALGHYAYPSDHAVFFNPEPVTPYWFAARLIDERGRPGAWSNIARVTSEDPLGELNADVEDLRTKANELRADVNAAVGRIGFTETGITDLQTITDSMAETISLVGARTRSGQSFVFSASTAYVDDTTSLGQYIDATQAQIDDKASTMALSALQSQVDEHDGDISALSVAITSLQVEVPPAIDARKTWDFSTGTTMQGWGASVGSVSKLPRNAADKGAVRMTGTGSPLTAAMQLTENVSVGTGCDAAFVAVRRTGGTKTKLMMRAYRAGLDSLDSETVDFTLHDGAFHVVALRWSGAAADGIVNGSTPLTGLRLYATNEGASLGGMAVDVLWIAIGNATRPAAYAEADQGLQTQITTQGGQITAISSRTTALESTVNNPTTGVGATATAVDQLKTRVTTAEGNITAVSNRTTSLESTVNNATTGVAATASAVDSLKTRVTSAEGNITAVSNRTTALESTVNNATTGVTATASAVSSLTTRVTSAEGNISSTSSAVTEVKSTLAGTGGSATNYATAVQSLYTKVTKGGTGKPADFIDIKAIWSVTLDVNGYVAGFQFANDGSTAAVKFNADTFQILSKAGTYSLEWSLGVLSSKSGSAYARFGAGFGADTDKLLLYSGSASTAASSSFANADVAITQGGRIKMAGAFTNYGSGFSGTLTYVKSGSTATISATAGTFTAAGKSVSYNASSVSVSGSGVVTYYLYYNDPGLTGGSKTLNASTNMNVTYDTPGYVLIGYMTVDYNGGSTPPPPPVGGGGGGGNCVCVEAVLPSHASAGLVEVGDMLQLVHGRTGRVSYAQTRTVPCVRVTTASGIALECSETAPLLCEDGTYRSAADALGARLVTQDGGVHGVDTVATVEAIGAREVRHITCENDVFWAGLHVGRYLAHHNTKPPIRLF